MVKHFGGCHCGAVRFEVVAPAEVSVSECNCSICSKAGYRHLVVPADRFNLLTGEDSLTTYTFNTHTAQHKFCSICGVKSFYVPRSHPDGYSVNARCIDPGTIAISTIDDVDGKNWETEYPEGRGHYDDSPGS